MRPLPRLIALSPGLRAEGEGRAFLASVERALAAGLPGVLLREPALSDRAYLALGNAVTGLRRGHPGLWVAVHDRAHLARALGADAVHLSFRSLAPGALRPWLGTDIALGLSTHAGDDPRAWQGADYLFHGPLHATPHKPVALAAGGLTGIARALEHARVPLFALGGVRPSDVPALRELGVHGVAVQSGWSAGGDPARATRAYLEALA